MIEFFQSERTGRRPGRTFAGAFLFSLLLFSVPLHPLYSQDDDEIPINTYGFGPKEDLGPNVNTEWAEIAPIVSPDGKRLYFTRKNAPGNVGGEADQDDIYYSELQRDGSWGKAINAGAPLNTTGSDVLFSITPDGERALLYSGKMVDGKEQGLSIARRSGNGWGTPQKITIDSLQSLGNYYYADLAADGKHLLLAFATGAIEFDLNILICDALDNTGLRWGAPRFIPGINSPFIESSPRLIDNDRTLLFVSDRRGGPGLADIFISQRTGDDWNNWSPPEALGDRINSPMFEADVSVTADRKYLYSTVVCGPEPCSTRSNIFRYAFPENLLLKSSIELTGRLVEKGTNRGIRGVVSANPLQTDIKMARVETDASGNFRMVVVPGMMTVVRGEAAGYKSGGINFDSRFRDGLEGPPPPLTIELERSGGSTTQPTATEKSATFTFATASAQLSNSERSRLSRLGQAWSSGLKKGTLSRITVIGYTDSTGTEGDNQRLGMARAEAVREILLRLGIPTTTISLGSEGENSPRSDNGTERGRSQNRRVEIRVD